jgi:hypothetical protein
MVFRRSDVLWFGEVRLSPTTERANMRRSWHQRCLTVVASALIVSCTAGDAVAPDASIDANGTWSDANEFAGSGTQFTLSVSGTAVAGAGTWSGEAICGGGVSVAGTARGDSLHLDLKFFRCAPVSDTGVFSPEHLDAALTSRVDFVGTITRPDGFSQPVHFVKRAVAR